VKLNTTQTANMKMCSNVYPLHAEIATHTRAYIYAHSPPCQSWY